MPFCLDQAQSVLAEYTVIANENEASLKKIIKSLSSHKRQGYQRK